VEGCTPSQFCPGQFVTREQMATVLARALGLPGSSTDRFVDDNGSPHEPDINALAEAGITTGCAVDLFCPSQLLSRQQLAGLLAHALELPAIEGTYFADYGDSPYIPEINALVEAGITDGCGVDHFCPWGAVNRAHMAALLRRSFDRPSEPAPRLWGAPGYWGF
ncbi:MAG: S-layer homology domain-containing protein, partial [Acidimicrobiia bacterium]